MMSLHDSHSNLSAIFEAPSSRFSSRPWLPAFYVEIIAVTCIEGYYDCYYYHIEYNDAKLPVVINMLDFG